MNPRLIIACVLTLVISGLVIEVCRRYSQWLGLQDQPGGHKLHALPVPAVGGIGIFVASFISLLWFHQTVQFPYLWAGLLLLLVVGIIDDQRGLPTSMRFSAQIVAVLLMVFGEQVRLNDFGDLLGGTSPLAFGVFSLPITVFCAVGVINAVNMIDGLDGLSGTVVLLALFAIAFLQNLAGDSSAWAMIMAFAVMAFLTFNIRRKGKPARVFLGNSGSLVLGMALAWLTISNSQGPDQVFPPTVALWLLAIPIIDTVSVMLRRIGANRSPFSADNSHIHHCLREFGMADEVVWKVLAVIALFLAAIGVAAAALHIPDLWMASAFVALGIGYHFWVIRQRTVK